MKKMMFAVMLMMIGVVAMKAQTTQVVNLTMKDSNKASYYPESRFAVVIGNKEKAQAEAVADSLNVLGFNVLTCYGSSTLELQTIFEQASLFSQGSKLMLLYFNGDVIQQDGITFLLPADVTPVDSAYQTAAVLEKCVSSEKFMEQFTNTDMQKRIMIFDAKKAVKGSDLEEPIVNADSITTVATTFGPAAMGQYGENLYAAKRAKEKAEQDEAMAAIAALDAMTTTAAPAQPKTPEEYYKKGMQLKSEGNVADAIENLKAAANGGNTESMYQLALLYQGRDEIQAMTWMGRASSAGHEQAKAWVTARKKPQQKQRRTKLPGEK